MQCKPGGGCETEEAVARRNRDMENKMIEAERLSERRAAEQLEMEQKYEREQAEAEANRKAAAARQAEEKAQKKREKSAAEEDARKKSLAEAQEKQRSIGREQAAQADAAARTTQRQTGTAAELETSLAQRRKDSLATPAVPSTLPKAVQQPTQIQSQSMQKADPSPSSTGVAAKETRRITTATGDLARGSQDNRNFDALIKSLPPTQARPSVVALPKTSKSPTSEYGTGPDPRNIFFQKPTSAELKEESDAQQLKLRSMTNPFGEKKDTNTYEEICQNWVKPCSCSTTSAGAVGWGTLRRTCTKSWGRDKCGDWRCGP
jgi:hypothetical protein